MELEAVSCFQLLNIYASKGHKNAYFSHLNLQYLLQQTAAVNVTDSLKKYEENFKEMTT